MPFVSQPRDCRRPRGDLVSVWRTPTSLQIGLDDEVLVLEHVPSWTADMVDALAAGRQPLEPADASRAAWRRWLLDRLDELGRLGEPSRAGRVRVLGSGPVAQRIAELLIDLGQVVAIDDATPVPGTRSTSGDALVRHLSRTPARRGGSIAADRTGRVDLTVVCTGTCEPDRSITDALTRHDQPFLVVRTRPGTAVAGPLVVPAQTSCLRCADLWRAGADPAWPRLAAQLSHRTSPDDPLLDAWVAAVALAQISAYLQNEPGELRSRTLTLSSTTGRTSLRSWPRHVDCDAHAVASELGNLEGPDTIGA